MSRSAGAESHRRRTNTLETAADSTKAGNAPPRGGGNTLATAADSTKAGNAPPRGGGNTLATAADSTKAGNAPPRGGGNTAARRRREFGEGPLARVVSLVYTVLAVEALAVLTALPSLILLMLLDRDASNLPLAALFAVPIGPSAAAALFTLHHRRSDLTDLKPAAVFWRGYRTNFVPVLRLWLPWLAWTATVAFIVAHYEDAGIPAWWAGLLVIGAVAATLWIANAIVICSLFAFRARDTARLAAYFLWRTPGVTLANACLLILAAGVTVLWSEAVVVLLASMFAVGLVSSTRPMVTEIQERFAG